MKILDRVKDDVLDVLENNILDYWSTHMLDDENGGFYGQITGNDVAVPLADKGSVLNARILWTFATAYRVLKDKKYLTVANRAKRYIIDNFYDKEQGGIFWSLNYKGEPVDTKKQIYAISFAIYGMSELHRASGDREALDYAIKMFHSIEEHSYDTKDGGYWEALTADWQAIQDMRLSEKDANEKKTMNTHLHIMEAYANLYRVWKDDTLRIQLKKLIEVFLTTIIDSQSGHLRLFFDEVWESKHEIKSYGHDIEASWLLHEAALVLDDADILVRVNAIVPSIVEAASRGLQADGSMIYECDVVSGEIDEDRHWWVQAEAVVGYLNSYQYFDDASALKKSLDCWLYIKDKLIDFDKGEWHWSIKADGTVNLADDKAGFWKCPYHNSRMCFEILERI